MTPTDPAETFRQEAREVLEQLEQALLDLDDSLEEPELINTTFRALHTIKGSGAMFGFTEVAEFVHEFETAFDRVRKGDAKPSPDLVSVALRAKDHIANLIAEPGTHSGDGALILQHLRAVVNAGTNQPEEPIGVPATTEKPAPKEAGEGWFIRFRLPEDALSLGANPVLLLDELRELGTCTTRASIAALPMLEALDPEICYLVWEVTLFTGRGRAAIEDVFLFVHEGMELDIHPLCADDKPVSEASPKEAPLAKSADPKATHEQTAGFRRRPRDGTSLRVAAERLNELLDHVGELVIAQARLSQLAEDSDDPDLKNVSEEIERLSAGLRDTSMGIRMVPIGTLFGRFRRLVHDLSADLCKEIDFVTSGEDTALDKTVIERLVDPLLHVIRNAVDHGQEDPESRVAAGKPRRGTVRLSAVHEGAEVAIIITDDGAGLDTERIRVKAEEVGLISRDATLSDQDVQHLIFHPGFSTLGEVSAISGRGVGMDVVNRTIDALRGRIDVSSRSGKGTTVTLRLPLTLAIIDGMLVRVGQNRYSIPLSAVEECVELPIDECAGSKGRNFLNIRDTLVPFLRLHELFHSKMPVEPHQKVVIVATGEHRVGLVVDQILGNSQTVIKPLSWLHSDIETFSGATILGDGIVALILDVAHLVRCGQRFETRMSDQRDGRAA